MSPKGPKRRRCSIRLLRSFGRVDILVNNAGIGTGGTTLDTSEEDWDRVIAVNLKGPFNCTQIAAKSMVAQKSGKIINISSISGLGGAPVGELAYCCAKAALIAMTTVSAQDLGPYGINVNSVAPWVDTYRHDYPCYKGEDGGATKTQGGHGGDEANW